MKVWMRILCFSFLFVFFISISVLAADKGDFSISPQTDNGKKWRIGYYEGGEYIDYQKVLIATVKGLMELEWIEPARIPPQKGEQTGEFWNWLATKTKSKYIEFVKDAHYSANWDDNIRKKTAEKIISRLNKKNDIDLMIATGTWAGQDLANNRHKTSTMVLTASDALGSGIIKSIEDSGYDHVSAWVDPLRFERQVQIFHDIVNFNKLGLAYENSPAGRTYGAIDQVEKVMKERGFEIVSCYTKSDVADIKIAEESVKKCFHELGKKADAIYVTSQGGVSLNSVSDLVDIANSYKTVTFTQTGSDDVKHGFLMSISHSEFKAVGKYHATTFAKVFNGAKPRVLDQIFEEPSKIAINLETATIIGYDPSMDVLGIVDEVYKKIEKPVKSK